MMDALREGLAQHAPGALGPQYYPKGVWRAWRAAARRDRRTTYVESQLILGFRARRGVGTHTLAGHRGRFLTAGGRGRLVGRGLGLMLLIVLGRFRSGRALVHGGFRLVGVRLG